jgi:hypothetical protein
MAGSLAILSLVCCLAQSLSATDDEGLSTSWSLTPETDRSHPRDVTLAIPVFRATTITLCELNFAHTRYRFNIQAGGGEFLALSKGGKMKVDLEVATAQGVETVEKRSVKVRREGQSGYREAFLGWVDPSGVAHETHEGYQYVHSDSFPLTIESGDVLLFSLKFTKKPKILGVERTETHLRRDSLWLSAGCSSCGTNDTPCPEE